MRLGTIVRAANLLVANPNQFVRKIADRLVPLPARPIGRILNGVAFECDLSSWPGRTMARGMFFGTFSIEIVAAMKRFLKTGDVFIDVGANIGYLSAVGMGLVGPSGEVHSFEPVPDYYSRLRKLAGANPGFRFFPQPIALSDTQGRCTISVASKNVGWNTLVPGFMRASDLAYQVEVQTDRLDSYIDKHNVQRVSLIKIDTEGFEFPVLRGLKGYFERGERPPIICEVATDAYGLLGYSISDFHEFMSSYGYRAYRITQSVKSVSSEPFDIRNARGTIDVVWTASSSRRISRLSSVLGAITE